MVELMRSNNAITLSRIKAALEEVDIPCVIFDSHTAMLEGSISAIRQRVMVLEDDLTPARRVMAELPGLQLDD